ncbi:MAG TPA: type II secretion system F family protein [Gaiellaceae bacterium]|nr:type II secretion system F family protein [Gaiellaceae bacterium]
MLLPLAVLLLAASAYVLGEVVTQPGRERDRAVRRAATYGRTRVGNTGLERLRFRERVLVPATASLAGMVLRLNPRVTVELISTRLLAAGMGRSVTPTAFLAMKGAGALGGGFVGFAVGTATAGAAIGFLLGFALAVAGFIVPGFVVSARGRKRREEIRAQLPDALDLLAVSVEAGLAFDGAVAKLTEHMEGALAEEFSLTLGEMRIGESRHDALKKLAVRAATPEVASFCRAIIQADQLGISLGRLLRVQAAESRLKRQAAAEERAMKSPIKMLFPTVIFIFPAMFIVILGPAMLNLMKLF